MYVNPSHLLRCFGKVDECLEHYKLTHIGADDFCRSVGNLKKTVETYLPAEIRLLELPLASSESVVWGMFVMRGEAAYDVCYVADLPPVWKRFVVCKELFHILIDEEKYRDMDIAGHVEALTVAFPQDDSRPRPSVVAEFLAEVTAMEFLFPRVRRLDELQRDVPLPEVADKYQVPLLFVERYLSAGWMASLAPDAIQAAATAGKA